MVVHAVLFDLWQTLIVDSEEIRARRHQWRVSALDAALAGAGFSVTPEQRDAAFRETLQLCTDLRASGLDQSGEDQVRRFLQVLAPDRGELPDGEAFQRIFDAYTRGVLVAPPVVQDDAVPMLACLREAGLRLGVVSNTGSAPGSVLRELLDRLGLLSFLDEEALAFSDEVGLCKPDPAIFHTALGHIGVRPEHAFFVGDLPRLDTAGARQAGLRPILLGDAEESEHVAEARISRLGELPEAIRRLDPSWRAGC